VADRIAPVGEARGAAEGYPSAAERSDELPIHPNKKFLAFDASRDKASQKMAKKTIPLYRQKPTPPLGEWLRQLRQERNLALREVAAVAEMDQAHLSKAELGQRLPTADQVVKLAKFFKVDATLMEAKRVAEKVMQEIAASSAGEEALNILREDPPYPMNQPR